MERSKFKDLFSKIFDKDGNIIACGREVCKELIETACLIDNTTDYGNLNTGIMNVDNLKVLYNSIK